MLNRQPLQFFALSCALLAGASLVTSPMGWARDNSGRQLAVVVPGLPHPAQTPTSTIEPKSMPVSASGPIPSDESSPVAASRNRTLSTIGTPTEVSPEVKAAVEKGAIIAQGLSRIAVKRASDFGAWMAAFWRQLNELPRVTPNDQFISHHSSIPMREISETTKPSQLYYTSEQRIKTVVGR